MPTSKGLQTLSAAPRRSLSTPPQIPENVPATLKEKSQRAQSMPGLRPSRGDLTTPCVFPVRAFKDTDPSRAPQTAAQDSVPLPACLLTPPSSLAPQEAAPDSSCSAPTAAPPSGRLFPLPPVLPKMPQPQRRPLPAVELVENTPGQPRAPLQPPTIIPAPDASAVIAPPPADLFFPDLENLRCSLTGYNWERRQDSERQKAIAGVNDLRARQTFPPKTDRNYKKQVDDIIRSTAWPLRGGMRHTGEHELFVTCNTREWWMRSKDMRHGIHPRMTINGRIYDWLDCQTAFRTRTYEVIYKDGSAHIGALYRGPWAGEKNKSGILKSQKLYHDGLEAQILASHHPLTAAIRALQFHLHHTMGAKEFAQGTAFNAINNGAPIYDLYDGDLTHAPYRRQRTPQYTASRNTPKALLRRLQQMRAHHPRFQQENPGGPFSECGSYCGSDLYTVDDQGQIISQEPTDARIDQILSEVPVHLI